jgi:hypothetical protein
MAASCCLCTPASRDNVLLLFTLNWCRQLTYLHFLKAEAHAHDGDILEVLERFNDELPSVPDQQPTFKDELGKGDEKCTCGALPTLQEAQRQLKAAREEVCLRQRVQG